MTMIRISLLLAFLALPGLTPAAAQQVHTPPPGTSERTQILDALRPSPGSTIQFIAHELKVIKGKTATYAYSVVDPAKQEYDGGEFILKKDGAWRVIWSVTGGGTDNCSTAATYYQSALLMFQAEGIDPDVVNPQLHEEYLRLATFAAEDPDCWALGDLGPEIPPSDQKVGCAACHPDDLPSGSAQARSRIAPHPRFPATVIEADLDGDGKPDAVKVVHILPGSAGRGIDRNFVIANPWDSDASAQALPDEGQPMALLVDSSRTGTRHLLHSTYVEISAAVRADHPVQAKRGNTRLARGFRKDCPDLRRDFLLMATDAGIDVALFWNTNANRYEVCWPEEIP
ncbi:hypothetical protein [Sphingorhabdus sp.]|uniref:hypothetical protein n=1 Tax=Sphingorhabdus sp. TaxID=1902408 RepID=UPI0035B2C84A